MPWQALGGEETGIVAIHAALLPTAPDGVVLCFGDWQGSGTGGVLEKTLTTLFDVANGTNAMLLDENMPDTNGFCGSHAWLADGRLLLGGGTTSWETAHGGIHAPHYGGERACWVYLPGEERWAKVADLNYQPEGAGSQAGGGRWYPTLVTLGDGRVFAIAGHPHETDTYNGRHNNNTPERYSPSGNYWDLMASGHTAEENVNSDSYPRYHLLPDGNLFCDTQGDDGAQQHLETSAGLWVGDNVDVSDLPGYYALGSSATSVLLPLLPPNYRPRIVAFNSPHNTAFRIDPSLDDPAWEATAARQGNMAGRNRENGCATLLPTGQVALTGGWPRGLDQDPSLDSDIDNATLGVELYDPGIDWDDGDFSGSEAFLDLSGENAQIGRGYHSTALLLPDGRVWTGGSTTGLVGAETRVEYYAPSYVGQSRPSLSAPPRVLRYGQSFTVDTDRNIERVALMRCGSITHGFDPDQRYVGCLFSQNGDTLTITAPPNGNIAPPGPYMLWVIDGNDRPCERAQFVRLAAQHLLLYTDRSTFSAHEIEVLGTPARFNYAFYLVLDGALPGEVEDMEPVIEFLTAENAPVPGLTFELASSKWEDPSAPPDLAQRLTFVYHIRFDTDEAFADIEGGSDTISLRASFAGLVASASLVLSENPNPWMRDGSPPWLSTDVRVFQIQAGQLVAGIQHGSASDAPFNFLTALIEKFEELEPEVENHPFLNELAVGQEESALTFAGEGANGEPIYNYAIAKVRMTAPSEVDADDVGVFFRLFTTASTGFEYRSESYPRVGSGANARPALGRIGGDIATIPFFAAARGDDGIAPSDPLNRKTIAGSGAESRRYFGCWLDINRTTPVFQEDGEDKSIQEILKGEHQCLVAEIDYALDPIPQGATPGANENLSQRNLIINAAPNPANAATRVIAHTLELAPSKTPAVIPPALAPGATASARMVPDELVFTWGNIPRGSQVTLYMPDVDLDEVMAMVALRPGAPMVARVDAHTLRLTVGGITYLPVPGGRVRTIPTLLALQLPPDLVKGTVYKATVKQFDGRRRRIIASVQLTIPITTAEEILPEEIRKLAVLRHIAGKLSAGNKWYPIFERYLGLIGDRVRGLGGDPDAVEPSPTGNPPCDEHGDGDGKPGEGRPGEDFTGKITAIFYDCFGEFVGFEMRSCSARRRWRACEPAIEAIVREACRTRDTLTVLANKDGSIRGIITRCCGAGPLPEPPVEESPPCPPPPCPPPPGPPPRHRDPPPPPATSAKPPTPSAADIDEAPPAANPRQRPAGHVHRAD